MTLYFQCMIIILLPSVLPPSAVPCASGAEFDMLSPEQQAAASRSLAVFARVEPLHKLRLVELLRDQVRVCVQHTM
jgi:magnesium-transporting ATPase (P-type)